MTAPLRDYCNSEIKEENCQLVTHYGGKKFSGPYDVIGRGPYVAIGPKDEVVIVDVGNTEVIIFDKDLKLMKTFGHGSGDSTLRWPAGVAVGQHVIAVSECSVNVVRKYSLQGDYLSKFGSHGSGDGQFSGPLGLCFNSKGLLYVVDRSNCRVQVFGEDNVFLFKFGFNGHNNLCYIAVDSSDQVYVTAYQPFGGICVFSEDGYFIKMINCDSPFAIGIAPDDYIITNVCNSDVLAVFSPTHELIAKRGFTGEEKGAFHKIQGIAINSSGTIFVTEHENHCLQIIRS